MNSFGFTAPELRKLRALKTPVGIQRFLDELPYNLNFTARSPQKVLRDRTASCLEGGIFAAAALRVGEHDVPLRLLPPTRLVGRDAEVAALEAAFAEAVSGTRRGVLVGGAAGASPRLRNRSCREPRSASVLNSSASMMGESR